LDGPIFTGSVTLPATLYQSGNLHIYADSDEYNIVTIHGMASYPGRLVINNAGDGSAACQITQNGWGINFFGNLTNVFGATSSQFISSGRGVLELDGTSQVLIGLTVGSAAKAYFRWDGTDTSIYSYVGHIQMTCASGSIYLNNAVIGSSTMTATNFILSSDARLKYNVEPIIPRRLNIDYKRYELYSETGIKRYGVIAQELEKDYPEFVRTDEKGYKSVAYIDLLISEIASLKQ
jgi:hypothetical protein